VDFLRCWDVGPALFSKVTLSNTVLSIRSQKLEPAARRAQVLRATTQNGYQLFGEKSAPSQLLCPPPQLKSWLRA